MWGLCFALSLMGFCLFDQNCGKNENLKVGLDWAWVSC